MQQYLTLMRDVMDNGTSRPDRTGDGTLSVFGRQLRFDLSERFPLVTTKRVFFKGVVGELLWFLRGDTNVRWLNENGIHIWDSWADEKGDLGPIYGKQWRSWDTWWGDAFDQITEVIESIRETPHSRRHIVTAWNPADLPDETRSPQFNVRGGSMCLAPCHCLFQFYVADGKLSCQLYQRSADLFLGVPFNIASYALLTYMIAQQTDLEPGEFIHTFGDVHLYQSHIQSGVVEEQLSREPFMRPRLRLERAESIFDYDWMHIKILNYQHHPALKAEIQV